MATGHWVVAYGDDAATASYSSSLLSLSRVGQTVTLQVGLSRCVVAALEQLI
jgi:hypothetical protein